MMKCALNVLILYILYSSRKTGSVQQRKDPPDLIISVISTSMTSNPLLRSCLFTCLLTGRLRTFLLPIPNTLVPKVNCSSSDT